VEFDARLGPMYKQSLEEGCRKECPCKDITINSWNKGFQFQVSPNRIRRNNRQRLVDVDRYLVRKAAEEREKRRSSLYNVRQA
jgi:hypothetical protein